MSINRKKFDEAISELLMLDEFAAECILSSIEGIELALHRKISEDEKMIAFSMYLSGSVMEQMLQQEESEKYKLVCLN